VELDYSEKWGKNVDEAVRLALLDLKLSENEVQVTVLEEPTRGFLGIGAKLAKVRVEKLDEEEMIEAALTIEAAKPEPRGAGKPEPRKAAEASGEPGKKAESAEPAESVKPVEGAKKAGGSQSPPDRSGGSRFDRPDGHFDSRLGGRADYSRPRRPSDGNKQRRGGKRPDGHNVVRREEDLSMYATKPESAGAESGFLFNDRPADLKPVSEGNAADGFLKEICEKMGLDVNIHAFENDDCVYIEMDGNDSRTVIGKRGQTLDAIQYLTNLVMNKNQEKYVRVIIDVEQYRSRREKTLEQLASKLARKVERSGHEVRLEPMNPYERKVIHSTLQGNALVKTRSEGEEPYRRVIIEKK
jgi:spoIIIJ-associated protein